MTERVKITVEMDVTIPQALALQAMFKCWNNLASMGASRFVAFYVDGDGNFKPKCKVTSSEPLPPLTEELASSAAVECSLPHKTIYFDFDPVAWKLRAQTSQK